jgi:hypothetical protein
VLFEEVPCFLGLGGDGRICCSIKSFVLVGALV